MSRRTLVAAFSLATAFAVVACSADDSAEPSVSASRDSGSADATVSDGPIGSGDATLDSPGTPPIPFADGAPLPTGQVDRAGRPFINVALNLNRNAVQDEYNQDTTFQDWTANKSYDPSFQSSLVFYDGWDGKNDWTPDGGAHPLVKPLELDALIVNTAVACVAANNYCEAGYLDYERLALNGTQPSTCGGLTPNEDAVSKTLTYFVTAGFAGCTASSSAACAVNDGVPQATKPAAHAFPYLQAPN